MGEWERRRVSRELSCSGASTTCTDNRKKKKNRRHGNLPPHSCRATRFRQHKQYKSGKIKRDTNHHEHFRSRNRPTQVPEGRISAPRKVSSASSCACAWASAQEHCHSLIRPIDYENLAVSRAVHRKLRSSSTFAHAPSTASPLPF